MFVMVPSIYINLEDDVAKITARIKKQKADKLVLVCPKRCFLFNDSINLRLLKKQVDLLKKEVYILTMDERGQMYAKEAGFQLKFLPKQVTSKGISDVKVAAKPEKIQPQKVEDASVKKQETHKKKEERVFVPEEVVEEQEKYGLEEEPGAIPQSFNKPSQFGQKSEPAKGKIKISVPKVSMSQAFFPREIEQSYKSDGKKPSGKNWIISIMLILVLLAGTAVVVFFVLPKATVVVYPKTEAVTRDMEVTISTNVKNPDTSKLLLPATKVTDELDVTQKFQSQGKKEVGNKAVGTVYIYNFTRQPLNLKANTTTLTVGSKNYVLTSDVNQLKPTLYKNAKTKEIDENSLAAPVEVEAAEGGDSSNVPAGTRMEISNQVFGSKPQFLYAKTATSVTGGTSRYLSFVSDLDISNSQKSLGDALISQEQQKLSQQNLVIPDKAYIIEPEQFSTDKPSGTNSPNFEAVLKAKITALAINKQDLFKLAGDRIKQTLATNKSLEDISDNQLSYKIKSIDLSNELAVLFVHYEGQAVLNVNLDGLNEELAGKSQDQVNEFLSSKAEINKIDITLAPSWQKNFPRFANRIGVTLGKFNVQNSQ